MRKGGDEGRRPRTGPPGGAEDWFEPRAMHGYPEQALAALAAARPGTRFPGANRLRTAWVLACAGHTARCLQRELALPADCARLLTTEAARVRSALRSPGRAAA